MSAVDFEVLKLIPKMLEEMQDLKKAKFYIDSEIEEYEKENK